MERINGDKFCWACRTREWSDSKGEWSRWWYPTDPQRVRMKNYATACLNKRIKYFERIGAKQVDDITWQYTDVVDGDYRISRYQVQLVKVGIFILEED